jgi:hypothetical protein
MNNFEKIKQMSIEEMIVFLSELDDSYYLEKEHWKEWLLEKCDD